VRRSLARLPYRRDLGILPARTTHGPAPRVTVLMATYNRSNVLRHAIASVRAQTVTDWEALVIGDAVTDDTADVVAAFDDPRIQYLDLPVNSGDHSGPNSVGARLARTDYVAWLSQDDLWLPDHLELLLGAVADARADGAIAGLYLVRAVGSDGLDDPATRIEVRSASGPLRVTGHRNHPASSWLLSAAALARAGDWRRSTTVRYATSQEYLFRVWASGARVVLSPTPSAVLIPSIVGDRAYGARRDHEQAALAPAVTGGDRAALDAVVGRTVPEPFRLPEGIGVVRRRRGPLRRVVRRRSEVLHRALAPLLGRLGVAPWELAGALVGEVRGESDAVLRHLRGLPAAGATELGDALVESLRAEVAELTAELARTQGDYRDRDRELAELRAAYARQEAELARTQADYRARDAEVAELRARRGD